MIKPSSLPAAAAGVFLSWLVVGSTAAQQIADPDYEQGYQAWKGERYPESSARLRNFRAKPYGERFEVDYWIGTGWCRMPGEERSGWDLLDWAMYAYPLAAETRATFKAERDLCRKVALDAGDTQRKPRIVVVKATGSGATASAEQTKLFYIPGGDKGALRAYRPRSKREVPANELDARLVPLAEASRAEDLARKLAPGATVISQGHFVLASASGHSAPQLKQIAGRLDEFVGFLGRQYGVALPPYFITVYLVPDPAAIRRYADRLHGLDVSPATLGYAFQNDLSVLALLRGNGVGTVLHELFHLAVRSTYGAIPQWMDEGMASLYETSTLINGQFLGEPNWRSIVLNEMAGVFRDRVTLRDVVTSRWFWDDVNVQADPGEPRWNPEDQAYMMALARYFTLFLQESGGLVRVFEAYRDRQPGRDFEPAAAQAVRLVEQALGKSITAIEADFWRWYPSVRNPAARLHTGDRMEKELPTSFDRDGRS